MKNSTRKVLASLLSILVGLTVGAVVVLLVGLSNERITLSGVWDGVRLIFIGILSTGRDSVGQLTWGFNPSSIGNMLFRATPLIMTGLSVALAFKTGLFNIGAPGQYLMGTLATLYVALGIPAGTLPGWLLWLLALLAGMLAGAIWGAIPAFFKAKFNTNETLFTLMMNYVAMQIVAYYSVVWENPKGSGNIGVINSRTMVGWFPQVGGSKYLLNIIIVAALTVAMYVYLKYSKQGYEISVVGESERTARYIGIKVDRVIIRTMIISGAICGIAGLLLVGGTNHTLNADIVSGRGFTAVMVAWLAKFNPIWMIFTSFLLVFLGRGAGEIATDFGLNQAFGDILTGIILFFIIGCEFFINYKLSFRRSAKKEEDKANV